MTGLVSTIKKGIWPPEKKGFLLFWRATKALIKAHVAAYHVLKTTRVDSMVGIAKDNVDFDSTQWNIVGRAIQMFRKKFWNHYFLKNIEGCQDFIGLNYYFHRHFGYKAREKQSDMGWALFSPAIEHVLKELTTYNLPIYITENGIADARDVHRAKFIREHIEWMKKAMDEGVDVRGYFYWSLLDNFEWDKGFWPRFGLVEIDYKTMERKVRSSAWEYKKIIQAQ